VSQPDKNRPSAPPGRKKKAPWQAGLQAASPYMGLGFQVAGIMLFYVVLGLFLDRWLETTPWLLIVGAVLGMVSVFVQIVRISNTLNREARARKEENVKRDT